MRLGIRRMPICPIQGGQRYDFYANQMLFFHIVTPAANLLRTLSPSPTYIFPYLAPMDAKITLSFDKEVARKAKEYAASQNISLSRLVEFLLHKTTTGQYSSLEDYPIADWVKEVSEGPGEYRTKKRTRKELKDEFFASRKK